MFRDGLCQPILNLNNSDGTIAVLIEGFKDMAAHTLAISVVALPIFGCGQTRNAGENQGGNACKQEHFSFAHCLHSIDWRLFDVPKIGGGRLKSVPGYE
jgi:hypothetical protein